MKKRNGIFFSIILIFVFFGCEGVAELFHGKKPEESVVDTIYVAGYQTLENGNQIATMWKDGVQSAIDSIASEARAIAVNSSDVYIAGNSINTTNSRLYPRFWKNGIFEPLNIDIPSTQFREGCAYAITIASSDVYVVGGIDPGIGWAYIWKNSNGNGVTGHYSTSSGIAKAIVTVGSDIYVVGCSGNYLRAKVAVWKNGTIIPGYNSGEISIGNSIAISGPDIYVAGVNDSRATLWKNGIAKALVFGTSSANAMVVVGSDVYVAGNEGKIAKFWKNDVGTNITDGTYEASINSLVVLGSDIYVAGYEKNANGIDVAKVWKNGVETALTDGYTNARANAMVVVQK